MEKQHIAPELLDRLSLLLVNKLGLHVPKSNWGNWENKIYPLAAAFGFANVNECISWLTSTELDQEELKVLARHLTIGETYFFRDTNAFKALGETILPALIQQRAQDKFLRIWSAACCTGEEPYSIAMLLQRLIPDLSQWNISILATDVNTDFLQCAEKGIYKPWSFRLTPEGIKNKYFSKQANGAEKIITDIQRMVKFMYLNLVEDKYPMLLNGTQAMDLILCNNVLIYFAPDVIQQVVQQLSYSLANGGWLLVSAVEVPYVNEEKLAMQKIHETTFFQKQAEIIHELALPPISAPAINFHFEVPVVPPRASSQPAIVQPKLIELEMDAYLELYEKGRYQEVVEQLEKLLGGRDPTKQSVKHMILLARSYACLGLLEKARKWVNQGLSIEKLDADLYLLQAIIYQELELTQEAISSLKNALFLEPNLIICYYVLGNLMIKRGDSKEGARNFRNALRLLQQMDPALIVPGSEGVPAGRLSEIITSTYPEGA